MTYQICILDAAEKYNVLFSTTNKKDAMSFFSARIADNFKTVHVTTPSEFGLHSQCLALEHGFMTPEQQSNLQQMVADPITFALYICM